MGRKSRLKKLRSALNDKLDSLGLEDVSYFVVSKTIPYKVPALQADGSPQLDENGQPKFEIGKFEKYTAKNPRRNLLRKLMKEESSTIKQYLKSFDTEPKAIEVPTTEE